MTYDSMLKLSDVLKTSQTCLVFTLNVPDIIHSSLLFSCHSRPLLQYAGRHADDSSIRNG